MKKRFIAGALCPACGKMDTIYVLMGDEGTSRHCCQCDFSESKPSVEGEDSQGANEIWEAVRLPGDSK